MFDIGGILTSFGEGITSLLPLMGEALVQTFLALFFNVTETATTLNPLGMISIFYLVISACYKFIPTVVGWFKLRTRTRTRSRSRASAMPTR